jgi:hypothetical protein
VRLLSGVEPIMLFDGANLRAPVLGGVGECRDAQWLRDLCCQCGEETSVGGVCCETQHAAEGIAYDKEGIALCCYGNESSGMLVPTLEPI